MFCGSATLLIEAGLINPNLTFLGFDNNGTSIAQAVKNIRKAGLIKKIELKNINIFDMPEIGTFDVITADLPFGMQISKGEDLEKLYKTFVDYSGKILAKNGVLVAYTTESELLQKILKQSKFQVEKTLELKVSTVVGAYIYPKIFVCRLKK
jgi:23S rRNA G2445 N2-methylase RlmL